MNIIICILVMIAILSIAMFIFGLLADSKFCGIGGLILFPLSASAAFVLALYKLLQHF